VTFFDTMVLTRWNHFN